MSNIMEPYLFKHGNQEIKSEDILKILRNFDADQCDVLYIHTSMQFGMPNLELGRTALLESLANILYKLNVPTLIMPSYTFSFCNEDVFNVSETRSSMGALNEYLRTRHHWKRSHDPLMSNILFGKEQRFITNIGKHSVGEGSTFDLLAKSGLKVKFLFFGPRVHECFTYMHYLEAVEKVPYRYNFEFEGGIVDGEHQYKDKYALFIRDDGVEAGAGAKIYENILIERQLAKFKRLGGGAITVLDLESAQKTYTDLLKISPSFYIEEVFDAPIRPTTFAMRKMVAL
jgi:aminoglycoside 3-N-acetyltransferase